MTLTHSPITFRSITLHPITNHLQYSAIPRTPATHPILLSLRAPDPENEADDRLEPRYIFALGDENLYYLHDAEVIIRGAIRHETGPLPILDITLPPDFNGWQTVMPRAFGVARKVIEDRLGIAPEEFERSLAYCASVGVSLASKSEYADLFKRVEDALMSEPDELDSVVIEVPDAALPVVEVKPVDPWKPIAEAKVGYGVIIVPTPEEIEAIRAARAPGENSRRATDRRIQWKFNEMPLYARIHISEKDAVRAQGAVHTYSRRTGRRFTTKRLQDKSLLVTRVEDAPNAK